MGEKSLPNHMNDSLDDFVDDKSHVCGDIVGTIVTHVRGSRCVGMKQNNHFNI